jgi:hypothetical protein
LGRAEIISQLVYFDVISYLINETDPLPFQAAFTGLDYMSNMLSGNLFEHQTFKV